MNPFLRPFFVAFLILTTANAFSQRIYGGQFDRRIRSTEAYSYGLGCTFFVEADGFKLLPAQLRFRIFRKRDNVVVKEYFASKDNDVGNGNTSFNCNKELRTDYVFARYNHNLILKPEEFSDAEGYFIVNDPVGTRSPCDNVSSTGMVLYHWFSPAYLWEQTNGADGRTTPQWVPDSYNYFCANLDNTFSLAVASVPQTTQLNTKVFEIRCRLVSPLTGDGFIPYREAAWQPGYSTTNQLFNSNLAVPKAAVSLFNPQGMGNIIVSAKPSKTGTYATAFLIEHYRNGIKLSETFREYQIQVNDCLPPPPAAIQVSEVNRPSVFADTRLCEGESLQLNAGAKQPNIKYQWFLNGTALAGQKDSVLVVRQKGNYHVVLSKSGACDPSISGPVAVGVVPLPKATIESSVPSGELCPNATVLLKANPVEAGSKFQWLRDSVAVGSGQATLNANQTGQYTVQITDANQCSFTSKVFEVKPVLIFQPRLDSIPVLCLNASAYRLKATPAGGIFTGTGVKNDSLFANLAGLGSHEVVYTLNGASACLNGVAKQTFVVAPPPSFDLGKDRSLFFGQSVKLNADVMGSSLRFEWTPSASLDSPNAKNPVATPDQTTAYILRVTSAEGCVGQDSITLSVFQNLYIPDVFTPNNDGQNDSWELKGLETYPDAEVSVFDRWGAMVFHAKGHQQPTFDGTYHGSELACGVYVYALKTQADGQVFSGSVLIIR